jgi:hypothetical protein
MSKYVTEYLEKMCKRQFEAGHKEVLLATIYACLELGRPMPEWLQVAFRDAYEAAEGFKIRSWDDVFGRPVPEGTHLATERRNQWLRHFVIERVRALKAEDPITAIDKHLFEKIGRELTPIRSGTTLSNLYYDKRGRELQMTLPGISEE